MSHLGPCPLCGSSVQHWNTIDLPDCTECFARCEQCKFETPCFDDFDELLNYHNKLSKQCELARLLEWATTHDLVVTQYALETRVTRNRELLAVGPTTIDALREARNVLKEVFYE